MPVKQSGHACNCQSLSVFARPLASYLQLVLACIPYGNTREVGRWHLSILGTRSAVVIAVCILAIQVVCTSLPAKPAGTGTQSAEWHASYCRITTSCSWGAGVRAAVQTCCRDSRYAGTAKHQSNCNHLHLTVHSSAASDSWELSASMRARYMASMQPTGAPVDAVQARSCACGTLHDLPVADTQCRRNLRQISGNSVSRPYKGAASDGC